MIKLNLISGFETNTFYDHANELRFFPPVYEQRYAATIQILGNHLFKGQLKKIADFGCSEMKLLPLVRRLEGVEHILQVDVDEDTLRVYEQRAKPLLSDYLSQRQTPLRIDIYKGSVSKSVECIRNIDAVIALELIEHVYPDILEDIPYNIFGYVKPKVAIFSTPNAEFNVLFHMKGPNGFRHHDHKFEWTREQFKDWCVNICERFPNYAVDIIGIGSPPPNQAKVGHVTQMAIFVRKDLLGGVLIDKLEEEIKTPIEDQYQLISSTIYPFREDKRSHEQKVLDEIKYHINRLTHSEQYYKEEWNQHYIPFVEVYRNVTPLVLTYNELALILLENGYKVENNMIIISAYDEKSSQYTDDEYDDNVDCIDSNYELWDE